MLSPIQTNTQFYAFKSRFVADAFDWRPGQIIECDPGDYAPVNRAEFSCDHYAGAISEDI